MRNRRVGSHGGFNAASVCTPEAFIREQGRQHQIAADFANQIVGNFVLVTGNNVNMAGRELVGIYIPAP